MSHALKDRVVLVAGATRGAGHGIAIELGVAAATVYCTGRTSRAVIGNESIRNDRGDCRVGTTSRRPGHRRISRSLRPDARAVSGREN